MGDSREFLDKYTKTKKTINSCTNLAHIKAANQMIENLSILCRYRSLPYDFYVFYINQLKSLLNEKISKIS